jgi:nucleoside-diphosphate-sugar epimerase
MRVLIIGCGYLGLATGRRLSALGHAVTGVRRGTDPAEDLADAGIQLLRGDITRRDQVRGWPGGWDVVINSVSSSKGGADVYREVYGNGTRHVTEWLQDSAIHRYIHISSTSVYGQVDGGWVTEDSPTEPGTPTGAILVEVERELIRQRIEMGFPAVILRVAGIYGPGRGHLLNQLLRDEARIQGDGSRWVNMVHVDDVARAILTVIDAAAPDPVYNVVDDEPVPQGEFLTWLAAEYDRPSPPTASDAEKASRKRGLTHKRVSNQRLRQLGWIPEHPTFRQGYARRRM